MVAKKEEVIKRLFTEMHKRISPTTNLHTDVQYIIRTAQIFGMFPVTNVLNNKYHLVCFKWLSPWTFYAIFSICATFGLCVISFVRMCNNDFKLHLLDSFLFCLNALIVLLAFFKLAMDWPKLLENFCKVEVFLSRSTYNRNLRLRFLIILLVATAAIFLEHSLAIANTYKNIDEDVIYKMNRTRLQQYFLEEFPFIFDYTEYNLFLALLTFFVNNCNVFSWSFIDSFIMMLSYALAYRFKQNYQILKMGINKRKESPLFWAKVREDYSKIAILCQKVNNKIGNIIVISFGANMFFIVTQLYKGLVTRRTTVDQCYFIYSFGLLVLRTMFVIIYGSMVHSESKKGLSYLVSIRSELFNAEVKRFILQVYTQDTSLTGGQYFLVTRGLLFQMASTIITYELFMIQAGINIYL